MFKDLVGNGLGFSHSSGTEVEQVLDFEPHTEIRYDMDMLKEGNK